MRKSLGLGLTAAAFTATVLTSTAGWAAVTSPAAHASATAQTITNRADTVLAGALAPMPVHEPGAVIAIPLPTCETCNK